MGDDLIFAQKFTSSAADGLALLVEMDNPRQAPDSSVVIEMMTTLQRGAKRLRARHIYSGAQGVLSALHHEDDVTLHGRIESLGSLVTQYARGLSELLPAPNSRPVRTQADKWDVARKTLNSLLPIAASGDADMLSRLMRAPVTLDDVQPGHDHAAINADIVNLENHKSKAENALEASDPADKTSALNPQPPVKTLPATSTSQPESSPKITLDAMMRDVITEALSVARGVDRTISLSYDMGERSVSIERAEDLTQRLGQALSQIIRQSLPEDRVGHIDINLAGEQLHIMTGTAAVRIAIDPSLAPAPKKLITSETEQDLRSQLDALMDPIAFHETAS